METKQYLTAASAVCIIPFKMKEYYYLDWKRKVHGPHTLEKLASMLRTGALEGETEVASPGDKRWVRLDALMTPALASSESAAPAALPPAPGPTGESHGFWANLALPLVRYAKFSGRATRAEYWTFSLAWGALIWVMLLGGIVMVAAGGAMPDAANAEQLMVVGGMLTMAGAAVGVALYLPMLAVQVRRLHDAGWSGWWVAVAVVLQWGYLAAYYFFCWDEVVATHKMVKEGLLNGDSTWMNSLQITMATSNSAPVMAVLSLVNMAAMMLWVLIVVVSFFESRNNTHQVNAL